MALHNSTQEAHKFKQVSPEASDLEISHWENSKRLHPNAEPEALAAAHDTVAVDKSLERRIVRKVDVHLLVLCVCINIFNFIDRSNIGNARILGMQQDLRLTGTKYNIAVMCAFISSSIIEIPFNIVCKKLGAKLWIPFIVVGFGIITTLMSLTQTAAGLYVARIFLGIAEGGVSPAIIWLLSQFYLRSEMGLRISIYISAAGSSGAFGGLFAIGLSKIPRWGLIHTWRNIYLFEGLISVLLGVIAFFALPNGPQDARFFTQQERDTAVNRLCVDAAGTDEGNKTKWKHVKQALKSIHVLGCGLGLLLVNVAQNALAVFTPTIIRSFGYSPETSQLLSVGPYVAACVVSILVGWVSDRYKSRSMAIILCAPSSMAGFLMLEFVPSSYPWTKYGAIYLCMPMLYACLSIWMSWCVNNCATATVRASASGVLFAVGSTSGIIAPWVYLSNDAPGYRIGHGIMTIMVFGTWLTAVILRLYCQWENRERESGKRDHLLVGLSATEAKELSSKHPSFRYIL